VTPAGPRVQSQHTNTQLYNILNEQNRCKLAGDMIAPYNAPAPAQAPTMDGFVTDYISTLTVELGRQPTYAEYSQVCPSRTGSRSPA
jgi:phospholipase C